METKVCFKCHLEQPLNEFYAHPQMKDGRLNKCKSCARNDARKHNHDNADHVRKYDRMRDALPHRIEARREYAQSERGRERTVALNKAWCSRNPIKRVAHGQVAYAIRIGTLVKQPCEVCGHEKAQAHHDDYSKPLDVRWLCTTHHAEWHKHNTPLCPEQTEKAA